MRAWAECGPSHQKPNGKLHAISATSKYGDIIITRLHVYGSTFEVTETFTHGHIRA
jgi:hypothetical protein